MKNIEIGTPVFVCTRQATGADSAVIRGFGLTLSVATSPEERVQVEMTGVMGGWVQVGDKVRWEDEWEQLQETIPIIHVPAVDVLDIEYADNLPDVEDEECPVHPHGADEVF